MKVDTSRTLEQLKHELEDSTRIRKLKDLEPKKYKVVWVTRNGIGNCFLGDTLYSLDVAISWAKQINTKYPDLWHYVLDNYLKTAWVDSENIPHWLLS